MSSNDIYYVYIYKDPDSLQPFYVGMGHGRRFKDHIRTAKNSSNTKSTKLNKIRKILDLGKEPIIDFYLLDVSKEVAVLSEIALIKKYGRRDIGTGILTNMTPGGDGVTEQTEETKRKISEANSGKTIVWKNGIKAKVSVEERKLQGLHGSTKGMTSAIDEDGNSIYISVEERKRRNLPGCQKGISTVKDSEGNILKLDKNDPRLLTKEFVGLAKGKVNVKDKDGNIFQVSKDDPRYISGELVGVTKGVKDITAFNLKENKTERVNVEFFWENKKIYVGIRKARSLGLI